MARQDRPPPKRRASATTKTNDKGKAGRGVNAPAVAREHPIADGFERFDLDPVFGNTVFGEDQLGIRAALAGEGGPPTIRSWMVETYGGGSIEHVPGFAVGQALSRGLWPGPGGDEAEAAGRAEAPLTSVPPAEPGFSALESAEALRAQSQIGRVDSRVIVPDHRALPWRCIALLTMQYADGARGRGTGWFISPRTLVTAAHCVHDPVHGRAATLVATPGYRHGQALASFSAAALDFNPSWSRRFERELDFALVHLDRPFGGGSFGFSSPQAPDLAQVVVNVAGYPKARPLAQWFGAGRIGSADAYFIYHDVDTSEGESGAPVFWSDQRQRVGLGVHTYSASSPTSLNVARRITLDLFELMRDRRQ